MDLERVKALKAQGRGHITAPGIDRIPLGAVQVDNATMAEWFTVGEGIMPTDPGASSRPNTYYYGGSHADAVAETACHSYIKKCPDAFGAGVPFHARNYVGLYSDTSLFDYDSGTYIDPIDKKIDEIINTGQVPPVGTKGHETTLQTLNNRRRELKFLKGHWDNLQILSRSDRYGPSHYLGRHLPFIEIRSAGNSVRENYYLPDNRCIGYYQKPDKSWVVGEHDCIWSSKTDQRAIREREAIAADKLLLVAGYVFRRAGSDSGGKTYTEDTYESISTGCKGKGITEGCIWAPYHYGGWPESETGFSSCHWRAEWVVEGAEGCLNGRTGFMGTSAAAPHVAASLASVLAVFPTTNPQELIRLARACAIPTPSLPGGVGRLDFKCLTRPLSDGTYDIGSYPFEYVSAQVSPGRMNALVFPGDARITGTFIVGRNGIPVTLGTRTRGAFSFAAGIPSTSLNLASSDGAAGFFPIAADGEGNPSVGGGYMGKSGLFAAAAFGGRPGFFGLGKRYGYVNASAVDVSAGHRNAYVRLSRQTSSAPYVRKVRGDALGFTATGTFEVGAQTSLTVSAHMDRFLGGRAATAFGPVSIDASPWNGAARLFAERRIGRGGAGGAVTLSLDSLWRGRGRGETIIEAGYAVRF